MIFNAGVMKSVFS